ncbi:MAG TPA: polysaccharide deacetylase family protein, partial [Burkholderiaceae bacterium]|nr:polysaccharide deacetylase family protein [Burkholderiaceae bacterium]
MKPAAPPAARNALTVDVEDYFQVSAFAPHIARDSWDSLPCRVEANVERILAMLDGTACRATFFTLGWVAERYPQLVRRIVAAGHELASHGYGHARVSAQSQAAFAHDIGRSKAILEQLSGSAVRGYR